MTRLACGKLGTGSIGEHHTFSTVQFPLWEVPQFPKRLDAKEGPEPSIRDLTLLRAKRFSLREAASLLRKVQALKGVLVNNLCSNPAKLPPEIVLVAEPTSSRKAGRDEV
jgi:hypothetical protein